MGNDSPKTGQEGEFHPHERFQTIKIQTLKNLNRSSQEEAAEITIMHLKHPIESQGKYKEWVREMQNVKDSSLNEVMLFPEKYAFVGVGMCGSGGIAQLEYQFFEFVLKTQIENRYSLKKNFLQTEIWYLLYSIVQAGSKFELLKKKIGNIHPQNILINENGQIKLISTCSIPGELSNYDQLLQESPEHQHEINIYLAPQEINHDLIKKGSYPSHVNPCGAEVFSIGITILSCTTLQNCNKLYTSNPYSFRTEGLNLLLRSLKEKYSDYLYQLVSKMLSMNPDQRITCSAIALELYQYEEDILDLQPFAQKFQRPLQQQHNNQYYLYNQPIDRAPNRNVVQSTNAPLYQYHQSINEAGRQPINNRVNRQSR